MSASGRNGDPSLDLMHLPWTISKRALCTVAEAGPEALRLFEAGHFDAARMEVDRCKAAIRVLDGLLHEQRQKAREEAAS